MIAAIPARARVVHAAFALDAAAAAEARRLALSAARGPLAASAAIGAWLAAAPAVSHDRRTALDPRLDGLLARLRKPSLESEALDAALAAWSPAPRDVWRTPERTVAYRVLRALRLVELHAPAIIVETELEGLGHAIAALDGPPPPVAAAPSVDPGMLVELSYAVARHARADLSLGAGTEVLTVLGAPEAALERAEPLSLGEPLVPSTALDARAAPSDDERWAIERLGTWKVGSGAELAVRATELANALAAVGAARRRRTNAKLDAHEHVALRGGDYVGDAEARLREIAEDAAEAEGNGWLIFADVAPETDV